MIIYDPNPPTKPLTPGGNPVTYLAGLGSALSSSVGSGANYATGTLKSVSDKSKEAVDKAKSAANVSNTLKEGGETDADKAERDKIDQLKNKKGGFSLPDVFKIVPIAANVILKGPTLASGATDLLVGLQKALVNTTISIFDLFKSLFSFSIQGFIFSFVLLVCFLENMSTFNSCVIFYFIDICLMIAFVLLFSFLSLLDALFFERLAGISLVQIITMIFNVIWQIEAMVFELSGFHLLEYPKCVQKMCYTCSVKSNHVEYAAAGKNLLSALTSRIPKRLSEPIGKFISAGSKFASIFKI
jgi:hypothetical protein